eukprot:TRINITY_DN798_c0_g2_i1.p2 TRINITY_DN798_c0_g2~~TRINITY_DN798_c0_g2_i1.p2  ORF type:complete len:169 (+),score=7.01 TRINITY_DN798_c0_g2_i1:219-725(+)
MFQDELRDVVVYYHEYVDFNYSMLQKHEGYGIVIVDVTNHEYVDYDVMNHVLHSDSLSKTTYFQRTHVALGGQYRDDMDSYVMFNETRDDVGVEIIHGYFQEGQCDVSDLYDVKHVIEFMHGYDCKVRHDQQDVYGVVIEFHQFVLIEFRCLNVNDDEQGVRQLYYSY